VAVTLAGNSAGAFVVTSVESPVEKSVEGAGVTLAGLSEDSVVAVGIDAEIPVVEPTSTEAILAVAGQVPEPSQPQRRKVKRDS